MTFNGVIKETTIIGFADDLVVVDIAQLDISETISAKNVELNLLEQKSEQVLITNHNFKANYQVPRVSD